MCNKILKLQWSCETSQKNLSTFYILENLSTIFSISVISHSVALSMNVMLQNSINTILAATLSVKGHYSNRTFKSTSKSDALFFSKKTTQEI